MNMINLQLNRQGSMIGSKYGFSKGKIPSEQFDSNFQK